MKRSLLLALVLYTPAALADDPPKPVAPVVPVASVVIPEVQPLIVFADGSVSKSALSWQVVEPANVVTRVEGKALIIPNPVPGTTYRLAMVATGDAPPYAFRFASITAPGGSPPISPPTPPVIPPATADALGMTAFTRSTLSACTWDATSLAFRQGAMANALLSQATLASTYSTPQAMVSATLAALKTATGPTAWTVWQPNVISPLETQINVLRTSGKIQTTADLAEVLREIATAFQETPLARR